MIFFLLILTSVFCEVALPLSLSASLTALRANNTFSSEWINDAISDPQTSVLDSLTCEKYYESGAFEPHRVAMEAAVMRMAVKDNVKYDRIFVSAHLDDAVWSNGGQMVEAVKAGEAVLLLNLFTGFKSDGEVRRPPWYSKLTLSESTLNYTQRRIEDETAEARIESSSAGHSFDNQYLAFPDLAFRSIGEALLGAATLKGINIPYVNHCLLRKVRAAVAEIISTATTETASLHFPLAVGEHPDHVLAFLTGYTQAKRKGSQQKVVFYQDIPYAFLAEAATEKRLKSWSREIRWVNANTKRTAVDVSAVWPEKIRAMQSYTTQIPHYWNVATFEQELQKQTDKKEQIWQAN